MFYKFTLLYKVNKVSVNIREYSKISINSGYPKNRIFVFFRNKVSRKITNTKKYGTL